jgi:hypothetical protein
MLAVVLTAVALAATPSSVVGHSASGRPIRAYDVPSADGVDRPVLLVFGCIHGDEDAGVAAVRLLLRGGPLPAMRLVVVPTLNPDGQASRSRLNGHGVDLNRNFATGWRAGGSAGDPEYPGPRPWSEPETRAARRLILRLRPAITVWLHQPLGYVRAYGGSMPAARRFARLFGTPFRRMPWLHGTAPNWQNHARPGTASFVVELPPGQLPTARVRRLAWALRRLR